MVVLIFLMIVFFFLFVGSCVFVCCMLLPQSRAHALSAALWCAIWGPCVCGVLTLAGLGLIVDSIAAEHAATFLPAKMFSIIGPVYFLCGLCVTVLIASGSALLHQFLIERTTFFLFRIYASFVSAGIGSVFGWALNLWMLNQGLLPRYFLPWIALFIMLLAGFGYAAYRCAHLLRGGPPSKCTWITPEEYRGCPPSSALQ